MNFQKMNNAPQWAAFWVVLMLLAFAVSPALGADILYIAGKDFKETADQIIVSRLEARGFTVDMKTDEDVRCEDADSKDLIIISESVLAIKIDLKFCDAPVPVLCSEPWLFDEFGMTGENTFADFGRKKRQKSMIVIDPQHPLAAALRGKVQVSTKCCYMGWGAPGEKAIKIAVLEDDHSKCSIFAYESGVSMPGRVAPAKRIGFFMFKNTAENFTPEGWALYDAVIDWAVGEKKS